LGEIRRRGVAAELDSEPFQSRSVATLSVRKSDNGASQSQRMIRLRPRQDRLEKAQPAVGISAAFAASRRLAGSVAARMNPFEHKQEKDRMNSLGALDEGLDSRAQPQPGEEETRAETFRSQNVSFRSAEPAFGEIIGQSRVCRQLIQQIAIIASTEATVLISGETGTGKELIARELHRRSRRKDKPLVQVNCACIPTELYESEFFGHVRGAFTSAIRDRIGRFEAATGGTLFLDEIGEIPLEVQGKLLRVLQEKTYERLGEDRTRRADVRIIAATNRDLRKEVEAGRFRSDLYYRLNIFPIKAAPLRDRREDIPILAAHFVDIVARELRCKRPRLTDPGIKALQDYHWPGNVRELRNVIERTTILAQGGALVFQLPVTLDRPNSPDGTGTHSPELEGKDKAEPDYFTETEIRRLERENILAVLRKTGWKIKGIDGAAELLGLRPTTLVSRMEKLGLKRPRGTEENE
jgi:transcriptional regulator with GAF, ATPase, and Fis domain